MSLPIQQLESFQILRNHKDAKLPIRSTDYAAGYDLYALEYGYIKPNDKALVRTGLIIRIPQLPAPFKVYASIRSRSGLSNRHAIEVGAGVIDVDYDKEVGVILHNHGDEIFSYKKHDRIAQLILEVHITPEVVEVDKFESLDSNRTGGFGSTGL